MKWRFLLVSLLLAHPVLAAPTLPDDIALGGQDVVLIGEVHDNPQHHLNRADILERLRPRAVVFEMLSPEDARAMEAVRDDGPQAMAQAVQWESSGWPAFTMYRPIFSALGEATIYGAEVSRDALRRIVRGDDNPNPADEADPMGISAPLDPAEQSAREAMQDAAHCGALPPEMLPGMVQAQRFRDAALARAIVDALREVGGPVAVITGNGHARRDWGVPRLLHRAEPDAVVLSIGQLEGDPGADQPFDAWILTPAVARPDPCAALR